MQFLKVVALTLISGAAAASHVARDNGVLLAAFADIQKAVQGLDDSIDAITPTSDVKKTTADLTTKSDALVALIKADTAKVTASAAVSVEEAATVSSAATKLVNLVTHVVEALTAVKPIIEKAGQSKLVVHHLQEQSTAAKAFAAAVTAKVPASVQSVAKTLGGKVSASLDAGITAFGGMPGMAM